MPRLWDTDSAMPILTSFFSRSRRVEAGILPKRDSSSTVARGAAHSKSSVSSSAWDRGWGARTGLVAGLLASKRSVATIAHVAASRTSTLSPTVPRTARGSARPVWPRLRNLQRVWRETPKVAVACRMPRHTT